MNVRKAIQNRGESAEPAVPEIDAGVVTSPAEIDARRAHHALDRARQMAERGDLTAARTMYEQLLVDSSRVQGADHPSTLTIQRLLRELQSPRLAKSEAKEGVAGRHERTRWSLHPHFVEEVSAATGSQLFSPRSV